jgi:hypothetical protein
MSTFQDLPLFLVAKVLEDAGTWIVGESSAKKNPRSNARQACKLFDRAMTVYSKENFARITKFRKTKRQILFDDE